MRMIAFIINLIIIICEVLTLGNIRDKRNILKYYTYLQNGIGLITSLIFCICVMICIVSDRTIPEFVKGLRYVATCGLLATMVIFVVFLGAGKKIQITEEDFLAGFSPEMANIMLHYVCPVLSLASFVFFEREMHLFNDIWTGIVAIPSCIYWLIYLVLSVTKRWEEPYHFAAREEKNKIAEILSAALIPLSFIAISFVLWNIQ